MAENQNNLTSQVEEIEALQSIYGDAWHCEDERSYYINIKENSFSVDFYVTLPETYPHNSPPIYTLVAPTLSGEDKLIITQQLNDVYLENIGQSVLYQWVEKIREFLQEKESNTEVHPSKDVEIAATLQSTFITEDLKKKPVDYNIEIIHGELIGDRRSTFQAHIAIITTVEEMKWVLEKLYENKKVQNATHNIQAYRILKNNKCYVQDCDDDGENEAGGRLLHLLQILDITNVFVVVTRWYGGVRLGPDRFRHINNAARQVLEVAGFIKPKVKSKK